MIDTRRRLWPFGPRACLITATVLLVGLLLLFGMFRTTAGWPSTQSENAVLFGILILSLLPIALAFLDAVIERGAVVEYRGVKLDFSQGREPGSSGLTVPANIGARGKPLSDSSTTEILDTLRQAAAHEIAVIDLEEGQAWWETRLLVLLFGAVRHGRPDKIIFVGTDARKEQQFQGWSYARDLLPRLAKAHPQFEGSLRIARAAANQVALIEPASAPGVPTWKPPVGPFLQHHSWMENDPATGLPNEFFAEQALQSELGEKIERQGGARSISLLRLEELFRPILNKDRIDLSWTADRQLDVFLETEAPFLAITRDARYSALVSRLALLNQLLKPLLMRHREG
ncbi:hypothetical protein [Burkholderia pyrrocinia]|uniref:Uncharacterized protein n=1 Tax=Burkholderia pyrrocinia TaxID=60550 RepID=A0ABZ3BNX6_BURPY